MVTRFVSFLLIALVVIMGAVSQADAWFGAGKTPGWPPTTLGLSGEIALPEYKFSPDFYTLGTTINLNSRVFNPSGEPITFNAYLVVSQVVEAPIGENVTDGDPDNPGLNENQLYDYHQAGNDIQTIVITQSLGEFTVPANGEVTIPASFTPASTGYYQFDVTHRDPALAYEPGYILTAGFVRVLNIGGSGSETSPSPTPIGGGNGEPTPTPTPIVTPIPTPTPTPNVGGNNNRRSTLILDRPCSESGEFKVTFNLNSSTESEIKNRPVTFTYKGESKIVNTNDSGGAQTSFTFKGESEAGASAEGFPSQNMNVTLDTNCNGAVLGASTGGRVLGASTAVGGTTTQRRGKILGASTLADTNSGTPWVLISGIMVYTLGAVSIYKLWRSQ